MINIAIIGYGNLGKGVEQAISLNDDLNCFGVFSRRDPKTVETKGAKVFAYDTLLDYKDEIDVCILCGSSQKDLRTQTPALSEHFNCVDSFDMHALIPEHLENVDKTAAASKHTSLVSVGWDPGLFSLQRALFDAILPQGQSQSFWGEGVSQGHSEAVKRIEGVKAAVQYTVPNKALIEDFKNHQEIDFSNAHKRRCYVVADEKDHARIEEEILSMPYYFKGSDTKVVFISQEKMDQDHQGMPHGGHVIRTATTSNDVKHTVSIEIDIDSNPEFTSSILVAYARAAVKMNQDGIYGGQTVLDVAPKYVSSKSRAEIIKEFV